MSAYGVEARELRQLPGELKNSFVVLNPDGTTFVIKLTDAVSSSGRVHMQADSARASGHVRP